MSEMEAPTGGRRCEVHGLMAGPGGACVLCRRSGRPIALGAGPSTGVLQRLITWVLAIGTAASIAGLAAVALRDEGGRTGTVVMLPPTAPPAPVAKSPPAPSPAPARAAVQLIEPTPDPASSPVVPQADTPAVEQAVAREAGTLAQAREIEERDRRRHEAIEADLHARAVSRARRRASVVMYSTAWCGACKHARGYMEREGIAFTEYDVEHDPAARGRARQLNPKGTVPTIEVGGREVLVGFDARRFEAALTRAAEQRAGS